MHSDISTHTVLTVPISRMGFDEALNYCAKRAHERQGGAVCFVNAHSITEARKYPEIHSALSGATLALADGLPLVWLSKIRRSPIRSRVCGPDFMLEFLRRNPNLSYCYIGGPQGQAEAIANRYSLGALTYSPPFRPFSAENAKEDWYNVCQKSAHPPAVVWVGLGAPKQELWMQTISKIAPQTLFFGVGAAFDFLTDSKRRAPLWMQNAGIEWLHRLFQEPKRLWRRYLVTNTLFIFWSIIETYHSLRAVEKTP